MRGRPPGVTGPRVGGRIGPRVRIGGRNVTLIRRQRHWAYWQGRRYYFVPLVALSVLTVGALAYSAYAYVPVAEPVCAGYTDDGCFFRWAEVPTADGILVPQCVAYCPR